MYLIYVVLQFNIFCLSKEFVIASIMFIKLLLKNDNFIKKSHIRHEKIFVALNKFNTKGLVEILKQLIRKIVKRGKKNTDAFIEFWLSLLKIITFFIILESGLQNLNIFFKL